MVNYPLTHNGVNTYLEEDSIHYKDAQSLVTQIAKSKNTGFCPFLPKAIESNSVWYEIVKNYIIEDFSILLEEKINQFIGLQPTNRDKKYKSLILIFPNIPFRPAQEILNSIQQELQKYIIEYKIVLGGFSNNKNNETLYLIVRHLVEADLSFLLKTPINERVTYLENYLNIFSSSITDSQYNIAFNELNKIKKQDN